MHSTLIGFFSDTLAVCELTGGCHLAQVMAVLYSVGDLRRDGMAFSSLISSLFSSLFSSSLSSSLFSSLGEVPLRALLWFFVWSL